MNYIISIIILLCTSFSFSQTVTKATRRAWAGGVCCITGTNFHVTIVFKKDPKEISAGDVWVEGRDKPLKGNVYKDPNTKHAYYISFGYSQNQIEEFQFESDSTEINNSDNETLIVPPDFEGEALIVLEINGKRKELVIETFEGLPMLAYP